MLLRSASRVSAGRGDQLADRQRFASRHRVIDQQLALLDQSQVGGQAVTASQGEHQAGVELQAVAITAHRDRREMTSASSRPIALSTARCWASCAPDRACLFSYAAR